MRTGFMAEKKLLVWGSRGFLAHWLLKLNMDFDAYSVSRHDGLYSLLHHWNGSEKLVGTFDTEYELIKYLQPDCLINPAAFANIDGCATEITRSVRDNIDLPSILAEITNQLQIRFIHISTDAVFGLSESQKFETDEPAPVSVYGMTKYLGELAVNEKNPDSLIVRTNFIGRSPRGNSLLDYFVDTMSKGIQVFGYRDVWFCPLGVHALCHGIFSLIKQECRGVIHGVGNSFMSKFELARNVSQILGLSEELVVPAQLPAATPGATRSKLLNLDNSIFRNLIGSQNYLTLDLPSELSAWSN